MKTKHKHWAVLTAATLGLTGLASASNLGSEKYTYDSSGNIIAKSIDGQVSNLSHDASNKIISVACVEEANEQINYDTSGRPFDYRNESGKSGRKLSYGYADKVLRIDGTGGTSTFFYNAEGQLTGKIFENKFTAYTWDGNVLAAQGGVAYANEEHPTGGIPVISGALDTVVSDYLGNTLSEGNHQFTSTAYGEGLERGRFTGKPYIEELQSFLFPCRLYSNTKVKWSNIDPSGFPDGTNNKSYVHGDPNTEMDPLGLSSNVLSDPATDELYATTNWTRYNQFWQASADSQFYNLPGFTASNGVPVELREKFEYARDSTADLISIPQDSFVDIEASGMFSMTVSGGISIYSTITFGAGGTQGTTVGIKKRVNAYHKGLSDASDYVSQANMHRESVYRTVERRYFINGSWGGWVLYNVAQPPSGFNTSGYIGYTHDKLGIGEYQEQ